MGIQGLLPLISNIHRNVHISEYAGQTVAVDGYVWLHKGAFCCAMELGQNIPTTKYVGYFMERVGLLKHNNVKPFIVFDGGYLPSKAATETDRAKHREENHQKGLNLLQAGKKKEAMEYFQKSIEVTPEMAYQVIKALKKNGIDYIVAPYEADAQLAYLEKTERIAAIITEDSDLLVFGCRRVLYKLDKSGNCIEIRHDDFTAVKKVSFVGWSITQLRQMCILSGCDYLPGIPGVGLITAYKLMKRYHTADKVIKAIRLDNQRKIPADYELAFKRAELTFQYQRVYDIESHMITTLNPIPADLDVSDMDFLGPVIHKDIAKGVANGDIHPVTKFPIADVMLDIKNKENILNNITPQTKDSAKQKSISSYFATPARGQVKSSTAVQLHGQQQKYLGEDIFEDFPSETAEETSLLSKRVFPQTPKDSPSKRRAYDSFVLQKKTKSTETTTALWNKKRSEPLLCSSSLSVRQVFAASIDEGPEISSPFFSKPCQNGKKGNEEVLDLHRGEASNNTDGKTIVDTNDLNQAKSKDHNDLSPVKLSSKVTTITNTLAGASSSVACINTYSRTKEESLEDYDLPKGAELKETNENSNAEKVVLGLKRRYGWKGMQKFEKENLPPVNIVPGNDTSVKDLSTGSLENLSHKGEPDSIPKSKLKALSLLSYQAQKSSLSASQLSTLKTTVSSNTIGSQPSNSIKHTTFPTKDKSMRYRLQYYQYEPKKS